MSKYKYLKYQNILISIEFWYVMIIILYPLYVSITIFDISIFGGIIRVYFIFEGGGGDYFEKCSWNFFWFNE